MTFKSISDQLASIEKRMQRLDEVLEKVEDRLTDGPTNRLLSRFEMREICGGISDPTLARRVKAGDLPMPKKIRGRNYWWLHDVIEALRQMPESELTDAAKNALNRGRRLRHI